MFPVQTNLMIRDSLVSFINTLPHRCVSACNRMRRLTCVTFGPTGGYCDLIVINYIDKLLTLTLIFWQCIYLTQEGSMLTDLTTLNPFDSVVILLPLCFWPKRPACEVKIQNRFISVKQAAKRILFFFFNLICESSTVAPLKLFTSLLPLFTASQVTEMGQQQWNLTGIVSWELRHHERLPGRWAAKRSTVHMQNGEKDQVNLVLS